MNLFRDLFFQLLEQFDRHVVIGHVDFAGAVTVNVGHFRRNWQERHFINDGFRVIPIFRVTFQHDTFVNYPVF
ncbi:hypothetical protein D3C78_1521950 [compost metagenome]